ncbi:GtrA family protein [Pseudoxanthomonas sp. 3HH-4]|uniref:GtrA family protein n=1 Tax=Pseudoxanthomonas sp. 3HH-4 TaxID=1690214 RepID=UPI0011524F62|nr:GtrA family protein [Pseudoxanthomonas sp. 3HH-4]
MVRQPEPTPGGDAARRRLGALAGEGFRMGVLSVVSLVLGYVLTILFHNIAGMAVEAAYSCAVVTCSVLNFFGCRHYVFRGGKGPLLVEAAKFFPSILMFRAVEVALFAAINRLLQNYHLAYIATAVVSMVFKLLISRLFIFKRTR